MDEAVSVGEIARSNLLTVGVTAGASGTAPSQPARGTLLAACESVGSAWRRAERAMRSATVAQPWHATNCLKRTSQLLQVLQVSLNGSKMRRVEIDLPG